MKWLRERGLGKAAERAGRESQEGAVAVSSDTNQDAIALVQLRSETDFGAKSPDFVNLANDLAALVASEGEDAVDQRKAAIEDLNISLKENVQLGEVVRFQAAPGQCPRLLPARAERPRRQRRHRRAEGRHAPNWPTTSPSTSPSAGPSTCAARTCPLTRSTAERTTLEAESRREGKPEAAIAKITEGKLSGWFKRVPGGVLLEQPYAKDDKHTVAETLGKAQVVRFAQVVI